MSDNGQPVEKPFAPACERNREPILARLRELFTEPGAVLEIGSGTGQHAVYVAAHLPHLRWQPSDVTGRLPGIRLWLAEAGLDNVAEPLALDVAAVEPPWPLPEPTYRYAFSANTAHILGWSEVERMVAGLRQALTPGALFCLYGPFSYRGRHTSEGNARFDATLRAGPGDSGIRDVEALDALAAVHRFGRLRDLAMPANNRLLVWQRD